MLIYQKVLYTGCRMASMLHHCDDQFGIPEASSLASDWSDLIHELAEVLL